MRIIPDNVQAIRTLSHGYSLMAYSKHATVEITDDELNEILMGYNIEQTYIKDGLIWARLPYKSYAEYFKELVELRAAK